MCVGVGVGVCVCVCEREREREKPNITKARVGLGKGDMIQKWFKCRRKMSGGRTRISLRVIECVVRVRIFVWGERGRERESK